MTYSIPEENMESLEKKLTRIKNKAKKYGNEFHYERIGEHFEEKTLREQIGFDTANVCPIYKEWTAIIKYIDIDVDGIAAVNGWKFAASLDFTEAGNIIAGTGEVEIPQRYYSCEPWCEHCKTSRDRRHSYIVYNEESGEFKQVGKSCLKDFTGGLSAEYVAHFESFLKEAEEAQMPSGGWAKTYFDVESFLSCAAETIRLFGYVRRDGHDISTADRTEELYRREHGCRLPDNIAIRKRFAEADAKGWNSKTAQSVELAKAVREWIVNNERDDNYFHNLKVACANKVVDYRGLGLLVSSFPAYDRELELEAKRREQEAREAESRARSSYMGEVGDKVSFEIADFKVISSWSTHWDYVRVYKFVDKDGLEATWKTSTDIDHELLVGSTITGKVKEQKEWNGIKQTELTRCKILYKDAERD